MHVKSLWDSTSNKSKNYLWKLQSMDTRIVLSSHLEGSVLPINQGLDWQTVNEMNSSESKSIFFKLSKDSAPYFKQNMYYELTVLFLYPLLPLILYSLYTNINETLK